MGKKLKSEMKPEAVLSQMRRHLKEQRPITLFNTYQGLPISSEAEVAMVHPGFVGLIVHPYQTVCIKLERRTFLRSAFVPDLVRAHPVSIDYTNHVVMFKKLKIPRSISVDLDNAWVKPNHPVTLEVQPENGDSFSSKLLAIAVLTGNSVRVVTAMSEDFPLARQDSLSVRFRLSSEGEWLNVQGQVQSLVKIRNKKQKQLEIAGKANMADEISILAYIAERQDQIMDELNRTYQKLRKEKRLVKH